jgi:DNA polymerase-1
MTLLLVDGNNLYMRAYFVTRHEAMTADGESTAALVVFTNILTRHIREEKPDRVVVCWDGGGSDYRLRLLPSYKANRLQKASEIRTGRTQVHEFLALAGIFQVERPGVEADDLIAKYWHDTEENVVIVSEDKDFFQLAGRTPRGALHREIQCEILRSTGERWKEYDVFKKMGAWPKDIPSVMALTGDESDNVIGVPGIGPKRAVALLEEAGWDLEAIEHPDVAQMRPQVLLNRVLVNLRMPIPGLLLPQPPRFRPTGPGSVLSTEFVDFMVRYQLKGLLGKLYSGTLWSGDGQIPPDIVSSGAT